MDSNNVHLHNQDDEGLEPARWENWDMQTGYHKPAGYFGHVDNLKTHGEKPIRGVAPGLHQGLTVMLDVKEDEYFCTGTESVGFKVEKRCFSYTNIR